MPSPDNKARDEGAWCCRRCRGTFAGYLHPDTHDVECPDGEGRTVTTQLVRTEHQKEVE